MLKCSTAAQTVEWWRVIYLYVIVILVGWCFRWFFFHLFLSCLFRNAFAARNNNKIQRNMYLWSFFFMMTGSFKMKCVFCIYIALFNVFLIRITIFYLFLSHSETILCESGKTILNLLKILEKDKDYMNAYKSVVKDYAEGSISIRMFNFSLSSPVSMAQALLICKDCCQFCNENSHQN